ncbi:hypothetical protein NDU88_005949 [Pleurodeles waltl]|uniref:Uncharacterized protein n=1 Tax=Pleurodeles waltl TaxID=8319 RepID=A0AAV7QMS6_PLEWA|nr:hypothetical protein NDU88_005949 [Pleurodeles waltl]
MLPDKDAVVFTPKDSDKFNAILEAIAATYVALEWKIDLAACNHSLPRGDHQKMSDDGGGICTSEHPAKVFKIQKHVDDLQAMLTVPENRAQDSEDRVKTLKRRECENIKFKRVRVVNSRTENLLNNTSVVGV